MHEPLKFVIHAYSGTTDDAWAFTSSSSVVICTKPSAHTNEFRNRTKLRYPVFCTYAQTTEGAWTWEPAWKNYKPAFFCVIIGTQTSTHAYELWNLMKMISSHLQKSRTTKALWGLICPSLAIMASGRTQNDDFQCGLERTLRTSISLLHGQTQC